VAAGAAESLIRLQAGVIVPHAMFFRRLVLNSFSKLRSGRLEVHLPEGVRAVYGGLGTGLQARIEIQDENFFKRCVLHGPIGFAESYMAGEWSTPDLVKVIAWFILNADDAEALQTKRRRGTGAFNLLNFANRLLHLRRPNSRQMSRENIREHYDLSNDFFQLWLDPTMTYSSAYFERADEALEAAQIRKYDKLCRRLHIAPTDSVLEIGSGWGGFSMHAAKTYGCRVTTVTISHQQFDEASRRIQAAGLSEKIQILLCDYRDLRGQFDKIASIEMLEAVGDKYVDGYFAKIESLLAPRGLAGLQAILCPDHQFPILRDGVDFIQKHIFPGSLLMSNARIGEALRACGDLNLFDYEDMAPHYALTLKRWRETFEEKLDAVRALGFDEAFLRKWRYYLAYCEAAFGTRHITVAQFVVSRPDNLAIPSAIYQLPA
jgi:cyclopropane-fatty-acyl-phospholipid synthase